MAVSTAITHQPPDSQRRSSEYLAIEEIRRWCDVIESFIEWQSRHILHASPTAEVQEDHKQGLKWLLRLTRLIHSVASDPEFPDKTLLSQLEAQMHQLEASWEALYNPMQADEAEKILAEAFPDAR